MPILGLLGIVNADPWTSLDGRLNAPSGTAQYPSLLNGYPVASPPNARIRWPTLSGTQSPWMVAGVDYAVGPPSGQTYTDPSVSPPANTSFLNGVLTVNADNVTINGYDFTLYNSGVGVRLVCSHNNLTITNCKMNGAGTQNVGGVFAIIDFTGTALTITNTTIDGQSNGSANEGQSTLISCGASNVISITLKYNWFKNYCQHIIEINNSCDTLVYQYNLIDDTAISPGAHMNWLQWNNSPSTTCNNGTVTFNTTRQVSGGGAEGYQWGPGITTNVTINNNTIVAAGASSGATMSYPIHVNDNSGGNVINGTAVSNQNYADITGAFGLFFAKPAPWTFSGNINMTTGGGL